MKRFARAAIYTLGMLVLALGITLNTKAGLGVSPIVSVAYCVSQITGLSFGNMTFALYAMFVVLQFVLRGRNCRIIDLLQLPLSLVFSRVLDLFGTVITYDCDAHGLAVNFIVLLAAVILTGAGVALTVDMRLIPNPGDGIVQTIAEKIGKSQGFTKNLFDVGCVCTTAVLGLVLRGQLIGIGLGTIVAMIGVGRVVALTNRLFKEKMCMATGVA